MTLYVWLGKERSSVRHTSKQDIEAYLKQVQNANMQSSSAYLVVNLPPTAEQATSSDALVSKKHYLP